MNGKGRASPGLFFVRSEGPVTPAPAEMVLARSKFACGADAGADQPEPRRYERNAMTAIPRTADDRRQPRRHRQQLCLDASRRVVLLATIGGAGMWAVIVVLPAVQAEFGIDRADASLAYTATMIGFAPGNVVIGRAIDRIGYWMPGADRLGRAGRRLPAGRACRRRCCSSRSSRAC